MGRSGKQPPATPEAAPREAVEFGEYSSPPCFMHELDPSYGGLPAGGGTSRTEGPPISGSDWPMVRQWRRETREYLIERRLNISGQTRAEWSTRISHLLEAELASVSDALIGFYWPFRGEFDARPLLSALRDRGTRLALPVVVEKAQPLQFREWWPGAPMTRGVWNIPIPAAGEPVLPDILLAPLVGFDSCGYRLGYGGGFYDRTLAFMPARPRVIGVGFELAHLETIYPQPHDIPMDIVITESAAHPVREHPSPRNSA